MGSQYCYPYIPRQKLSFFSAEDIEIWEEGFWYKIYYLYISQSLSQLWENLGITSAQCLYKCINNAFIEESYL